MSGKQPIKEDGGQGWLTTGWSVRLGSGRVRDRIRNTVSLLSFQKHKHGQHCAVVSDRLRTGVRVDDHDLRFHVGTARAIRTAASTASTKP